MASELNGIKVAILVANGFEQVEMTEPKQALEAAGAVVKVVSPEEGEVKGWNHTEWGNSFKVDVSLKDANADDYDALMLPGGVMNPDKLRLQSKAIEFEKHFVKAGKPIAAICHALDFDRCRRSRRASNHILAFIKDGSNKRRSEVG